MELPWVGRVPWHHSFSCFMGMCESWKIFLVHGSRSPMRSRIMNIYLSVCKLPKRLIIQKMILKVCRRRRKSLATLCERWYCHMPDAYDAFLTVPLARHEFPTPRKKPKWLVEHENRRIPFFLPSFVDLLYRCETTGSDMPIALNVQTPSTLLMLHPR